MFLAMVTALALAWVLTLLLCVRGLSGEGRLERRLRELRGGGR